MGPLRGSLRPVLAAAWYCIAVVAIWEIQARVSDSTLALTAGTLLLASLVISKCAFGLNFTAGPMLYLIVLGLFHLGLVVPWMLGIYDISKTPWFNPHGLSRALALIIYSILSFQSGVFVAFGVRGHSKDSFNQDGSNLENAKIFAVGGLLLLAAVVTFVFGLIKLDPLGYYRITYFEIFRLQAETDPRFFGSGITIAFIGLCLSVSGASKRQLRFTFLGTGLWVSILFYLGFRGPALIAGLIVYAVALKKGVLFPKWLPWIAAAFLLVAVPIESRLREQPLNERFFATSLRGIDILDGPAEMGTSIRPLVETADLIGPGDYRHGKTYLVGIKGIVPNLAFRWLPSSTESIDNLPPSQWITAVVDPWSYRNYGGMGFSAVAEPYMNFGTPGLVIFFLTLAFLLVLLERVSIRSSHALASWALVVGSLLWTTRNDFSNFFRPTVWGLLCLGVILFWPGKYTLITPARQREQVEPNCPDNRRGAAGEDPAITRR
ncbi:MAG: O-antigen polysaccharide polymerase Wzy [Candidatus Acidiferrales bacterium]